MKILILLLVTTALYAQRPPLLVEHEIILNQDTYIIPDTCFHQMMDITPFKGDRLSDFLIYLNEKSYMLCGVHFAWSPLLINQYPVKIRKTKGVLLELLDDALRGTDLQIVIIPPRTVGVRKYYPDLLIHELPIR